MTTSANNQVTIEGNDLRLLACKESIKSLDALSQAEQEAIVDYVVRHNDWRGEFNVIHNLQELLCKDLKNALKGLREIKHASLTKTGPFALELAVIRHYIKQNLPHEVFATLRGINTPEIFKKERGLSHRALFSDLFGEDEAKKAFKWYPDEGNSIQI